MIVKQCIVRFVRCTIAGRVSAPTEEGQVVSYTFSVISREVAPAVDRRTVPGAALSQTSAPSGAAFSVTCDRASIS
jgi:hypothetical protein